MEQKNSYNIADGFAPLKYLSALTFDHHIEMSSAGGMDFRTQLQGHALVIDGHKDIGGTEQGPSPKQLLLVSLGLYGIDMVSLLRKMRADFDELHIAVRQIDRRHRNTVIHVVYKVLGAAEARPKMEKAVHLSLTRYCGVTAMLAENRDPQKSDTVMKHKWCILFPCLFSFGANAQFMDLPQCASECRYSFTHSYEEDRLLVI